MIVTPRTEIQAVNTILRMVGESPVNSLELSELAPGALALDLLREVSRAVQLKGWYFNRRKNISIVPDISGRLPVGINTLAIKPAMCDFYDDKTYTVRRNVIYNVQDDTDIFGSSKRFDMILGLDFDDLPAPFREYITMKAGMKFASGYSQSDLLVSFSDIDVKEAMSSMNADELRNSKFQFKRRSRRTF